MNELAFTLKDVVMLLGFIIPVVVTFGIIKYRQNIIEKRVEKLELRFDKFKDAIYTNINELVATTHDIQLDMKGLETSIQKTVIDSIGKLINKIK